MIKDLKLGFKMMKYGINKKGNITIMIIFFVLGIAMLVAQAFSPDGGVVWLSGYYMTIAGMYLGMLIITSTVSTLVQSSPYKYTLQVKVTAFVTFMFTFVAYLVYVGLTAFLGAFVPGAYASTELVNSLATQLVATAISSMILQIYMTVAYKAYWISLVFVLILVLPLLFLTMNTQFSAWVGSHITLTEARLAGIACCVIGYVISRILAGALYRYSMSEASYKKALERDK